MGSGLIYIIIVGMWIAYFLPRWIASHEEVSGRSIEKFALTMKVVGKTSGNAIDDLEELLRKKESQFQIRRILFLSILGLTTIITLFILVGFLSPAIITIPISGIGLYVVHARHQISAIEEEIALAKSASENKHHDTKYSELIARSKRVSRTSTEIAEEQWTPLAERVAKSESEVSGITIIPKGSADAAKTWNPISVPPPSYVNSSKATPRVRIDTSDKSAGIENELDRAMKPTADEVFDQTLAEEAAEQIRINRAANE